MISVRITRLRTNSTSRAATVRNTRRTASPTVYSQMRQTRPSTRPQTYSKASSRTSKTKTTTSMNLNNSTSNNNTAKNKGTFIVSRRKGTNLKKTRLCDTGRVSRRCMRSSLRRCG